MEHVIKHDTLISPTVELQSACWFGDLNATGQGLKTSPFKKLKNTLNCLRHLGSNENRKGEI